MSTGAALRQLLSWGRMRVGHAGVITLQQTSTSRFLTGSRFCGAAHTRFFAISAAPAIGSKKVKPITKLTDAIPLVKSKALAKFDETIEIALRLNIDPRKPEQSVRGLAVLPKGTGKSMRIAVFATGVAAADAIKAGATIVGGDDLVDKIKDGFLDFDRCVATPAMMKSLSKVARILGPRGMMPNPKLGTVTDKVADVVSQLRSGITFKAEKAGIIHASVGKASFADEDLMSNIDALVTAIQNARPKGVKEPYFLTCFMSSTMSESVRLDPAEVARIGVSKSADASAAVDAAKAAVKKSSGTGWVDKARAIDWNSVDPASVASNKLRKYLQARRDIAANQQATAAA